MAIVEGIAAAKAAFEVSKVALDLTRFPKLDTATIQAKLLELQGLILSAQQSLGEAAEENRQLKVALDDRETLKAVEADLEFVQDGGFLVKKSQRAQSIVNPLCPICWGEKKQIIPLVPMANGFYTCFLHKSSYQTAAYKAEQNRIQQERTARLNHSPDVSFWGR